MKTKKLVKQIKLEKVTAGEFLAMTKGYEVEVDGDLMVANVYRVE